MEVLQLDATLAQADWPKVVWDIPADNVNDLKVWLFKKGTTPKQFKRLPVYKANVRQMPWLKDL